VETIHLDKSIPSSVRVSSTTRSNVSITNSLSHGGTDACSGRCPTLPVFTDASSPGLLLPNTRSNTFGTGRSNTASTSFTAESGLVTSNFESTFEVGGQGSARNRLRGMAGMSSSAAVNTTTDCNDSVGLLSAWPRQPGQGGDPWDRNLLELALDELVDTNRLFLDCFRVLSPMHRRFGGQGVVQFCHNPVDNEDFAIKYAVPYVCFCSNA
jgi:hypothetical protein